MKHLTKVLINAGAVGALALGSMAPALAQERGPGGGDRGRGSGGISAGEIIAGALVIGGIAAIASSGGRDNDRDYYGRAGYRGDRYGYGGGDPRQAVERCVRAAERDASRGGYGRANVTDVGDIDRTRYGYEVRGRIAVSGNDRGYDRGYGRSNGRGWDQGRYERDDRYGRSQYDSGSFRCKVEGGHVVDLDFSGISGI